MAVDPTESASLVPPPTAPEALRPHVAIGDVNEQIPLYKGQIQFTQGGKTFSNDATVSLHWLPSPAIRFVVSNAPIGCRPQPGKGLSLLLDDGTEIPHCLLTEINFSVNESGCNSSFSGIINRGVVRPCEGVVNYVMFLLPNFSQPMGAGVRYPGGGFRPVRLVLKGGGWIITLDAADEQSEVEKYLKANSGYGIMQVGRLEKEDQSPFTAEEAKAALRALAWYVSFAAGRWTGPCLPTGFDAGGKPVWEVWDCNRTVPFQHRVSWLDHNHCDQFEEPFPGFMKLWFDDTWEEVIRLAIHWYIEANEQAGSIEGSIVLTQTAFELLASAVLADHNGRLSQKGHDKITAAERIRLLFSWAGIPTGIPDELGDLVKLAKSYQDFMVNKTPDAAAAMTTIRNTITHPTRKNREKFGKHSYEARGDAWTLGLRNLELCLLKLFEHQGTYADRTTRKRQTTRKWQGEVEPVPWK